LGCSTLKSYALAGALALTSSCVSGDLARKSINEYVSPGAGDGWAQGQTSLTECLDQLGAPNAVWAGAGVEVGMAWYGSDVLAWGASVSVPTGQLVDASASFADIRNGALGIVASFDPDWLLVDWAEGNIADLVRTRRLRPSLVE
jgi:hypothetical protein